ncbi:MAG: DNA/RNA non-specific endonuclease [Chitinophagaceae bacterium]|nr:MAG: DNA/RNA non-specific endonuclease [Chitinophagaceae bacterium]
MSSYTLSFFICCLLLLSCKQESLRSQTKDGQAVLYRFDGSKLGEDFESGPVKSAYAKGNVKLRNGHWLLENALIGTSDQDKKNGNRCLRVKGQGMATMLFHYPDSTGILYLTAACYGNDKPGTLELQYSQASAGTWQTAGSAQVKSGPLQELRFAIRKKGPIRFRLINRGSGRLNVDDIRLTAMAAAIKEPTPATSITTHLIAGIPDKSSADQNNKNHFTISKAGYTLSYNNSTGVANWVAWHLSPDWKGNAPRCNCFESDSEIPSGFFRARSSDYIGTGFDRGHMCPSEDRDRTARDNQATFLMTNILPQAPGLNQGAWKDLEEYCRELIGTNKELYIIAGGMGKGGTGLKGAAETIAGGKITVPAFFWKIIVVLEQGEKDSQRINGETRVIAVLIPNVNDAGKKPWQVYRVPVDAVERITGYDFFNQLSLQLQQQLESAPDTRTVR